jgi:hypothetical protein
MLGCRRAHRRRVRIRSRDGAGAVIGPVRQRSLANVSEAALRPGSARPPRRPSSDAPSDTHRAHDPIADLADKRDDAAVVGELQAAPAPAQPIGREHRFTLEADKRPAVSRGNQPQLPEATHSIGDAFERAALTPHTTVNQGKSSHGRSFARGHKKATRPTREFGKSSRRTGHLNPRLRSRRRGRHRHRQARPRKH